MIRVRIEGTEEEMLEFMEKMPDIPGFEKTHTREPRKGNNPKYDSSKNVLAYLSYKRLKSPINRRLFSLHRFTALSFYILIIVDNAEEG